MDDPEKVIDQVRVDRVLLEDHQVIVKTRDVLLRLIQVNAQIRLVDLNSLRRRSIFIFSLLLSGRFHDIVDKLGDVRGFSRALIEVPDQALQRLQRDADQVRDPSLESGRMFTRVFQQRFQMTGEIGGLL